MSKYLVTGGAGFIGGHTTELLVKNGHKVVVLDNFSTGNINNLAAVKGDVEVIEGDILDDSSLAMATKGVDYCIHFAAEISAIKSVEDPVWTNKANVEGTLRVLLALRDAGAKRLVLASSSAVYGDTGKDPQSESLVPAPISPYGASKICAEHYCSVFNATYGVETVRMRYFNVFGPRQNPKSQYAAVIPKFTDLIMQGKTLHIYGDGEQTRDFVFVENVAKANYLATTVKEAAGGVFNIASETSISVKGLAEKLRTLSGKDVEIVHDPPVAGEIKYSLSDISQAREVLGFTPWVSFDEGLERTYDYFAEMYS